MKKIYDNISMSKSHESQLFNIQEPYKWINRSQNKSTNRTKIVLKLLKTTAGVLMYILLAAICFYMISIWLTNCSNILPRNDTIQDLKRPVIVWYTPEVGVSEKEISCLTPSHFLKCDVYLRHSQPNATTDTKAYLFYAPFITQFPLPRGSNVLWGLLHDESPLNNLIFMQEKALNLFNFSATYSRHSDVPFPLMAMRGLDYLTSTQYFVNTQKKNFHLSTIAPVMYLESNSHASTNRDSYVQQLMQYIQIDSYGSSLQNKILPINKFYTIPRLHDMHIYREKKFMYDPDLLEFIGRYKFFIAIENAVCDDYVSEKLWRALELGVVPIYFGSPLIRDWLPNNKSAILLEDYPTPELLSQYLHYLLQNDTAYEDYLIHKTLGKISNQKLINEMRLRPYQNDMSTIIQKFECLMCEKLHNKHSVVNMMSKKQLDCPAAMAAMPSDRPGITLLYGPGDFVWRELIHGKLTRIDRIYDELRNADGTVSCSNTSWRDEVTYF